MEAEKNEIAREQRAAKFASRGWKGRKAASRNDGVAENTLCTHGQRRSNAISVCQE